MRIISKFKDYYDGGMAHGQDRSLVYLRDTAIYGWRAEDGAPPQGWAAKHHLPGTVGPHLLNKNANSWWARRVEDGCVYFCGKSYPFYVLDAEVEVPIFAGTSSPVTKKTIRVFSWDKEFPSLIEQRGAKTDGHWQDFLQNNMGRDNPDLNIHYRSPIVVWMPRVSSNGDDLIINANLKEIGFQKIVDPFTAFQEISMFLGGVLGQNLDPPATMTDKEKIVSHGLDPVYGFRTPSPGNKARKQK